MLISNYYITYLKDDAIKQNYYTTFFKTDASLNLNLFERWCNQAKLLHHFFSKLRQVWKCWKDDAIIPNYYITYFKTWPNWLGCWAGLDCAGPCWIWAAGLGWGWLGSSARLGLAGLIRAGLAFWQFFIMSSHNVPLHKLLELPWRAVKNKAFHWKSGVGCETN